MATAARVRVMAGGSPDMRRAAASHAGQPPRIPVTFAAAM
jgi:hypothetical protein